MDCLISSFQNKEVVIKFQKDVYSMHECRLYYAFHDSDIRRTTSDVERTTSDVDRITSEVRFHSNDIMVYLPMMRDLLTTIIEDLTADEIKALANLLLLEKSMLKHVSFRITELVESFEEELPIKRKSMCGFAFSFVLWEEIFPLQRNVNKLRASLNMLKKVEQEISEIQELLHLPFKTNHVRYLFFSGHSIFFRGVSWIDLFLGNVNSRSYYGRGVSFLYDILDILSEKTQSLPASSCVTILTGKPAVEHCEWKTPMLKVEIKSRQFCSFLHDSRFQDITKDIACYTGIEEDRNTLCKLLSKYVVLPIDLHGNQVDTSCERTSLKQGESLRKQVENHVKNFFKTRQEMVSENNQKEKNHIDDENHVTIKEHLHKETYCKENQSENSGLLDVVPEIFNYVEIRPSEVVAYPATQQRILEPFLNKFTSPDSAPSKHDTMAVEFLRLCTMHDYPSTNGPSLLRLAQNGFYYDGNGTELICFSCGVKIRNWKYDDSPHEIHLKASPTCRFLLDSGDGNVPVPREDIHEELASSGQQPVPVMRGVEADGPRAAVAEPANNTAVLTSADSATSQSKPPPRGMVVKHPEYEDRSQRLASYKTFPRHMKQHPADMTDAGFYYAGFGDCCRCFHCGVGLRNWDPEDNPWIEHARWSPDCPYILEMKGQPFIDLVQEAARAAEMADDDDENEEDARNTEQNATTQPATSGAKNSGAPADQSSLGIENNVVKTSEAMISQGTPVNSEPVATLPDPKIMKAPLRSPAAQTLVHDEKIKPRYVQEAIDELVKKEGWTAFKLENIRKYLKIQEDGRKSANSASAADPNVLKQENKELKDLTICKICLDEKVSIVFLPCGHLVSCPQCAPALTKCPICRKIIKGTVRTNLVEKNNLSAKK